MAVSNYQKGSIVSDLHALLKSGECADVTFVVGQSLVPAHSFILAARSPVFAAMFRNDMLEASSRRIQISDMREGTLRQLLSFVYTDTVPQLHSVAADLLPAADKYDLPLLKQICQQQMEQDLSVENAADTATLAVLHRCPELRSAAVQFIAGHPEVMATEGWEHMLQNNAGAAVHISKLVAAQPRPVEHFDLPVIRIQLPENRIVPRETRQKMASNMLQAAQKGSVREVWALLTAGAPKDARDSNWNTALHLAAAGGHVTTVKCLLDFGLDVNDVNAFNYMGETPLHLAAHNGDRDIIWMLVGASAEINAQDDKGQTPLHVATMREMVLGKHGVVNDENEKRLNAVKTLLVAGAKTNIKNREGKTPKEVATYLTEKAFNIILDP